ncbi:hypothetical protein [Streptomyces sp. NPDC005322]|uniref:hypothetical protein n=1 Tax=unclassified Streptomyces TaxID=2593676 RepID=UPI0033A16ECF
MPTPRTRQPEPAPAPEAAQTLSAGQVIKGVLVALGIMLLIGLCAIAYLVSSLERDIEAHDGTIDVVGDAPETDGSPQAYENGAEVTFGTPRRIRPIPGDDNHRPGDLTYTYTVTISNDTGKTLRLGSGLSSDLYEGQALPDSSIVYGTWKVKGLKPNTLPDRLAPDDRMEATVRVNVPPHTPFLNHELRIAEGYETIYMKLGLSD